MCYETCCYEKMNDWYTHYFLTSIYKILLSAKSFRPI